MSGRQLSTLLVAGLVAAFVVAHFFGGPKSLGPSIYWTSLGAVSVVIGSWAFYESVKDERAVRAGDVVGRVYARAHKRGDVVANLAQTGAMIVGALSILALTEWPSLLRAWWYKDVVLTMLLFLQYALFINRVLDATLRRRLRMAQRLEAETRVTP